MNYLAPDITIHSISDIHHCSNNFRVVELIGIDERNLKIKFRFINDTISRLDFRVGDKVNIVFSIASREWLNPGNGITELFNSIEAVDIRSANE